MMLMADNGWTRDDFSALEEFDAGGEDLSIDIETLMHILDEKDSSDREDLPLKNLSQDESAPNAIHQQNLHLHNGIEVDYIDPVASCTSYDIWDSGHVDSKLETADPICTSVQTCSASLNDWCPPVSGTCCPGGFGVSQFDSPGCSTALTIAKGDGNQISEHRNKMDLNLVEDKAGFQFEHVGNQIDSKYASHSHIMENLDVRYVHSGALAENWLRFPGSRRSSPNAFIDLPFRDVESSHNVASTDSTICHSSEVVSDIDDHYSTMRYCTGTDDTVFTDSFQNNFPTSLHFQYMPGTEEDTTNRKDEEEGPSENVCSGSRMAFNAQGETSNGCALELSVIDFFDGKGQNVEYEDINHVSPAYANSLSNTDAGLVDNKMLLQPFSYPSSQLSSKHSCIKYEGHDEFFAPRSAINSSVELIDEAISRHSSYSNDQNSFTDEDMNKFFTGILPAAVSSQKQLSFPKEEKEHVIESRGAQFYQGFIDETSGLSPFDGTYWGLGTSGQYIPHIPSTSSKKHLDGVMDETDLGLIKSRSTGCQITKVSPESLHSYSSECKSHVDDDPDICILEDISQPARSNQSLALRTFHTSQPANSSQSLVSGNTAITSYHSSHNDSSNYNGVSHSGTGGTRPRPHDEHYIFRAALQDLSQPKSEDNPPDGVLAVPLLRHQRIALSWMVQKETCSLHCSGGILADDQGLGKTVSTIALILKEKPPSCRTETTGKCEMETLNLDDDDEDSNELAKQNGVKLETDQVMSNGVSAKSLNFVNHRGRPAAGTLVVCPTSVLRQWDDELRNKVTSEGRLSVLVYHGSNRTKDPYELAKYDVVITTYAIVSMEVPKQPLVDKEDSDEKIRAEHDDVPPMFSSSKKRKFPPGSDKKGLKHRKGMDGKLLGIAASGPLAKVGWFRVVLDEAQSIKNHRTQVARACWGLRAKRRWCLSGTPIQNAIDDLYSYFRFLRYDPYAVYKLFCAKIKFPITKDPAKGYRKLQAVLKTIMLRRTKSTLLDGKPIINLPPKTIELKKVDFTKEERDFYNQLEIDSRNQFKEYAAAGTVKQNYVNILLMLLRLRQACDHPRLVEGFDSKALLRSSVEMARKLPHEQLMSLLNCLEASLAICGICNDPPEDAVVSICGHVFCYQCICEHLTGDNNQCPARNCKARFSISAVFSKAALNCCLSEKSGQQSSTDSSSFEIVEAIDHCPEGLSFDSSKIKAALEVLRSLSKPQEIVCRDSSSQNLLNGSSLSSEKSTNLSAGDLHKSIPDKNELVAEKSLTNSSKVVGEKAIVFSQWTKMLDLLEASLKTSSIQYRRLDGTMSITAREKAVKDFNTLPEVSVMIMSLKAASLGLNMVAACHVLMLDLWWNPTTEDQAIDRAHRIGQTRPVSVLRLMVRNTVEDRILALQQKKRQMVASAFGEDETGGRQTRLTVEDLNYLFKA